MGDGPLRWGILGTGNIAGRFAEDLSLSSSNTVVAVGSRAQATADRFAARLGIDRAYGTVEQLVQDDLVEAVYVATPNTNHHRSARLALEAGKAVLVEKPFTMDARQAHDLADLAKSKGLFLMEAMWTRWLPHMAHIRRLLEEGRLGDVRMVIAEHGVWFAKDANHRLYAPSLGGGALLDLGVYLVSLASMVMGTPRSVQAVADMAFTGVDAQTAVVLQYPEGRQAVLTATLETLLSNRATISGSEARIDIEGRWYRPTSFTLTDREGVVERFDYPDEGSGLRHEAEEVARCVRAGLAESPVMPVSETVGIMSIMDEVRTQIGLRFPGL